MSFSNKLGNIIKNFLPAPFTIAVLLSLVTFLLAFFISDKTSEDSHVFEIVSNWEKGLWDSKMTVFTMQMMLMLVLGHSLALTKPIKKLINKATYFCSNSARAAAIITFSTLIISLFNWGLGLIFGAIFARKVGEYATRNKIKINYPLIGASGYSGMMVWHGGVSGSAPLKIAEEGHFLQEKIGIISQSQTVFSLMNIYISITLLIILPIAMYLIGKKSQSAIINLVEEESTKPLKITGAEKLDHSNIIAYLFGGIILIFSIYKALIIPDIISLKFITPNFINLLLLALCIIMHQNFYNFLMAVDKAIRGASGILIQFPLYFGIMGIMKYSGMIEIMSDFFIEVSTKQTFPILTFLSAGIVNIFVPSGGGQWAVQGPIIVESAIKIGVSIPKAIMSLAYGDQITNMLQPFWALPLLSITGLKAKEILPYTLILMLIGSCIFIIGLLIF
ncbi:MAG: short-chain fatty acid transporter [Flavobacteriales bacterium]